MDWGMININWVSTYFWKEISKSFSDVLMVIISFPFLSQRNQGRASSEIRPAKPLNGEVTGHGSRKTGCGCSFSISKLQKLERSTGFFPQTMEHYCSLSCLHSIDSGSNETPQIILEGDIRVQMYWFRHTMVLIEFLSFSKLLSGTT